MDIVLFKIQDCPQYNAKIVIWKISRKKNSAHFWGFRRQFGEGGWGGGGDFAIVFRRQNMSTIYFATIPKYD